MAITVTDPNGRQYRLSGAEEQLLQPLLEHNTEARIQLIAAIVKFDNRRQRLCAEVLAGRKVGNYGQGYEADHIHYKRIAIGWICAEYRESMDFLREVLGEGADDLICTYRTQASQNAALKRAS